jgi:Zn-dependent peptidase ImmA (M78 family)
MSDRVRQAAEQLLREAGVHSLPVPINKVAKAAGVTLRFGPLPDDLSGFLFRQDDVAIIGVNSTHPRQRQSFTVAHELGHLRLHPARNYVDHQFGFYRRDSQSSTATDKAEMEANRFAAELLMPAKFLEPLLKGRSIDIGDEDQVDELARTFRVSTQAMTFRLINLGVAK